jgi:hypothetical protein
MGFGLERKGLLKSKIHPTKLLEPMTVIILLSLFLSPMRDYMIFRSEMAESLRRMNYKGLVLFDQIGCNGDGISRFQIIDFNGSEFDKRAKRIIKDKIPSAIERIGKMTLSY